MKRTKKLLTGFIICMALAVGISISQGVQAANDDFIIQDEVSSQDSISDSAIQDEVTNIGNASMIEDEVFPQNDVDDSVIPDRATSNEDDFYIYNGRLWKYLGSGGDIVIPDGVKEIRSDHWFTGVFENCTTLTSITIPDSVTKIDSNTFKGCTNLRSIKISNNLTEMGSHTFKDCTSLRNITIPSGVTTIEGWSFEGCSNLTNIILPNSVTNINYYAFKDCTSLTNVTIPDNVTSIETATFWGCTNLTSVALPDSITKIDNTAFSDCKKLAHIRIPNNVTSIGWTAFYNCSSLINITIPANVTEISDEIGSNVFDGCTSLQEINVDVGNSTYSSEDGVLYNKDKSVLIVYPGGKTDNDFTIPNGVARINNSAFSGCTKLLNITIPNSITEIDGGAFLRCSSLINVRIPDSVAKIGWGAFSDCSSLANVTIPNSVTEIGSSAFYNCSSLEKIIIPSSVTEIKGGAFDGTPWLDNKRQESLDHLVIINNILIDGKKASGTVVIPDKAKSITDVAFAVCDDLINITIPNSVTSIGECAFCGCENLKEITILNPKAELAYNINHCSILDFGDGNTEFKNSVVVIKGYVSSTAQELANHMNNPYRSTTFQFVPLDGTGGNTPKPTKPKTPNKGTILKSGKNNYTVTKKGSEVAFTKISSAAASVSIPATVKIGGITYKVTSISPNAFKGNKKISKVGIGANITSIGKDAFNGCKNLKSIIIKTTKLKNVGQNAFKGIKSTAKIKVPSKQLKAYKKLLKGKGQGKKVRISK